MGGRGASSGGGGGGYMAAARNAGISRIEGKPPAGTEKMAAEIINGASKVLKDFGMDNRIPMVEFVKSGKELASMDGLGTLEINTKYLENPVKSAEGYHTADTPTGTGTHEAGHRVAHILLEQVMTDGKGAQTPRQRLEVATARSKGKLEKAIIKEAAKRYGSNPSISTYGSKNVKEKIAEAISDVYSNGNKANPYSKEIVNVMKDINNGKFKPTIKVSKSEMGI